MFKNNKKYFYIFIGVFITVVVIQYLLPKPVNWNRTYMSKDKSPFGSYAIYNLVNGVYSDKTVLNNQTLYALNDKLPGNTSILMVDDKMDLNKNDVKALFSLLEKGNTVFISATQFQGHLADSLHLGTQYTFFNYFENIDSLIGKPGEKIRPKARNFSKKEYMYSQVANMSYFTSFDSSRFKVKALLPGAKACLINAKIGKGQLYLMSVPDVFGNYFVVNHKNRELTYLMLSLIKNKELIWDEHYKTYNVQQGSILKFILDSDPLYAAYLLMFFSIIIYMVFEGRRRQRAIPVKEPVKNTTLEFVNVVTHVYYNSKNHQSIAAERIKYFYETVRKKFSVNTTIINEDLMNEVSELSGVELKKVKQLFIYCERLLSAPEISEYDLVELDRQISNFNKNSLR